MNHQDRWLHYTYECIPFFTNTGDHAQWLLIRFIAMKKTTKVSTISSIQFVTNRKNEKQISFCNFFKLENPFFFRKFFTKLDKKSECLSWVVNRKEISIFRILASDCLVFFFNCFRLHLFFFQLNFLFSFCSLSLLFFSFIRVKRTTMMMMKKKDTNRSRATFYLLVKVANLWFPSGRVNYARMPMHSLPPFWSLSLALPLSQSHQSVKHCCKLCHIHKFARDTTNGRLKWIKSCRIWT